MSAIPAWAWWTGGVVVWVVVGAFVGMWVGDYLRRRRELADFADWAREKHAIAQQGGLVIEFGHDSIRISSGGDEHEIPIAAGSSADISIGATNKRDPDESLH